MTTITETSIDERVAFIADLRALADFFEQHPAIPKPYLSLNALICSFDPAEFAKLASALGGERKKDADESYLSVIRPIGQGASIEVYAPRDEVCERVQVGTETVEVEETVTPAVTRTVAVEQPVYRWDCKPVLAQAVETSPLGDTRDHAVACGTCGEPTFNHSARCNEHLADAS